MTQIPRKPTFPSYMVQKLRTKIQADVQDDVIPVSTGIYSYEKLKNKLEAIPKPQIENYEDKIFFQIIEDRLAVVDKTGEKCLSCEEEYNMKKNPPVMCNFCAISCCTNCMPFRKRPHPLSKDGSGKRYNVCQRCDTKYLNLQLGHSYVQNRTLMEQAIVMTSEELQNLMNKCQEYQETVTKSKQTFEKNKFKISQLRKEKLELTKEIKNKMPEEVRSAEKRQEELKVRFVEVHQRHKGWTEVNEVKRRQREEKQREARERQTQRMEREREENEQRIKGLERERMRKQEEEEEKEQRLRRERERLREEQEQNGNRMKMKKVSSLQQNSTLSLNLTYSNSQLQELEAESIDKLKRQSKNQVNYQLETEKQKLQAEKLKLQAVKQKSTEYRKNDGGYESYRREESDQEQQVRARQLSKTSLNSKTYTFTQQQSPKLTQQQSQHSNNSKNQLGIAQQQQQFEEYFRRSQLQSTININMATPMQRLTSDQTEHFSFNAKTPIDAQQQTHYQQEQLQTNSNTYQHNLTHYDQNQTQNNQQYTFQNHYLDQEPQEIPISSPKTHEHQEDQDNNKLSYIDDWYHNKSPNNPSTSSSNHLDSRNNQVSSLSSAISNPTSTVPSKQKHKLGNKKQQELEEECTKSTSELDEEELEVARYSLIKAARDSAVQERQRNKIYQKSIYETDAAPYDPQQAEGVGQIKKCQCSIY